MFLSHMEDLGLCDSKTRNILSDQDYHIICNKMCTYVFHILLLGIQLQSFKSCTLVLPWESFEAKHPILF